MNKNVRVLVLLCSLVSILPLSGLKAQETKPNSASTSSFQLKQMSFESSSTISQLKLEATGGLADMIEEKLVNPGRLILDFPYLENTGNYNLSQMNDAHIIPRVRLATKPDRLRIIIDTVVDHFPVYQISKNSTEVVIRIQKTPEQIQEALTKAKLFAALQKGDRESQLKLGSEDEGGLLFDASQAQEKSTSAADSFASSIREAPGAGISADGRKRVVFMLQDNKPYKIFLEESQTPVHIERIRPGYEVKGVQGRLKQLGYNTGLVDGDVGPQTREALKKFQKDKGLAVTGTPNKKTQRELRKEFGY